MSDNKNAWRGAIESRKQKINGYQQHGRILIPDNIKEELKEFCPTCGESTHKRPKVKYFGEFFCQLCVDKMKNGFKP